MLKQANELFDDDNTAATLGISIVPPMEHSPALETITWADYAATAQTGDIVLYCGKSFISDSIKLAELGSKWSHVALVVVIVGKDGKRRILVLESTGDDGTIDLTSGGTEEGPRLADAEANIRRYISGEDGAMVVVRRLYVDKRFESYMGFTPASRLTKLMEFVRRVEVLPYEKNVLEFMRAAPIGRWVQLLYSKNRQSKNSYFCSELVYEAQLVMGLVVNRNPSIVTPADYDQVTQTVEFPAIPGTGKGTGRPLAPLVGLGPHLKIMFPTVGSESVLEHPGGVQLPVRPQLTVPTPKEIIEYERKRKERSF